jgi:hypothetical protein
MCGAKPPHTYPFFSPMGLASSSVKQVGEGERLLRGGEAPSFFSTPLKQVLPQRAFYSLFERGKVWCGGEAPTLL